MEKIERKAILGDTYKRLKKDTEQNLETHAEEQKQTSLVETVLVEFDGVAVFSLAPCSSIILCDVSERVTVKVFLAGKVPPVCFL